MGPQFKEKKKKETSGLTQNPEVWRYLEALGLATSALKSLLKFVQPKIEIILKQYGASTK